MRYIDQYVPVFLAIVVLIWVVKGVAETCGWTDTSSTKKQTKTETKPVESSKESGDS